MVKRPGISVIAEIGDGPARGEVSRINITIQVVILCSPGGPVLFWGNRHSKCNQILYGTRVPGKILTKEITLSARACRRQLAVMSCVRWPKEAIFMAWPRSPTRSFEQGLTVPSPSVIEAADRYGRHP